MKALMLGAAFVATPLAAQTTSAPIPVAAAAVDPARLAAARSVVAKLLPPGIYRIVMNGAMSPVIDSMGTTMKSLPLRQLAQLGGLDAQQAAALDKVDIERLMTIYDPHWQQRMQLSMRAMFDAMGTYFTTLEPELRDAYARAYANRFSLAELRDLDAFFTTPTGGKYAAKYMTLATDPAVANEMRAMMPKLMQQMPTFVAAAQKATAGLPPPRKVAQLSPAEKAELSKALGVPEGQLKDPTPTP